jgi:hypothetical protein
MLQRVHVVTGDGEAEVIQVVASVVAPLGVFVVGVVPPEELLLVRSLRVDLCSVKVGVGLEGVGGLPRIGA